MLLHHLPPELLQLIVTFSLPEGFEGLALSCKPIYKLCKPYVHSHNVLHAAFHQFEYRGQDDLVPFPLITAFSLLACIIEKPVVARYIRHAALSHDSRRFFVPGTEYDFDLEDHYLNALHDLVQESTYVKEASLDPEEYFGKMEESIRNRQYSQYAAAFLLTLLPNVEHLIIPAQWISLPAPEKLIKAVVCRTRRTKSGASLYLTTKLENPTAMVPQSRFDMDTATPLLALPSIESFVGRSICDDGTLYRGANASIAHIDFGCQLQIVNFLYSSLDHRSITEFLRHTPRLKSFTYSHQPKTDSQPKQWDICSFVNAITKSAPSGIRDISITLDKGNIVAMTPGRASLTGLTRLRSLELPIEAVMCNIDAASSQFHTRALKETANYQNLIILDLVRDLVPESLEQLSVVCRAEDEHIAASNILVREILSNKGTRLPALEEFHLSRPYQDKMSHQEHFDRLQRDLASQGVKVFYHPFAQPRRR